MIHFRRLYSRICLYQGINQLKRIKNKELIWMVNGYCWEVENTKGKHRCKMGEFMERENAKKKL